MEARKTPSRLAYSDSNLIKPQEECLSISTDDENRQAKSVNLNNPIKEEKQITFNQAVQLYLLLKQQNERTDFSRTSSTASVPEEKLNPAKKASKTIDSKSESPRPYSTTLLQRSRSESCLLLTDEGERSSRLWFF